MASANYKDSHSTDALLQNISDGAERMAKICDDVWNLKKERDEFLSAIEDKISGTSGSRRNSFRGDIGELATLVQTKLELASPSSSSSTTFLGQDPKTVREFFTRLTKFEGKLILFYSVFKIRKTEKSKVTYSIQTLYNHV